WPECDETPARQSLSVALSSLRRQLEPPGVPGGTVLIADRFSVQLNPSAITTDVALFEAELDQAPGGSSPGERSQHLSRAVELYAGEFLPGCYEDWCLTERERLFESYLRALRELIAELEGTGNLDRALQYARQAVNADPLREETQSELIRLLIAAREPAAALRQYRELERLLKRELDEAPSLSTQELLRQIERQGGPEQESEPRPSAGAQIAGPSAGGALADRTPPPASARKGVRSPLPSGTVTFLVSNLDLSPERREELGPAAEERWNACRKILREELRAQGGLELPGSDDPFAGVFGGATEALQCSLAVARRIAADNGADHLRVVLHTGEVPPGTADYADSALETATQLLWASHGGQVVCAEQTAALLRGSAHPGAEFTHLGLFHLAGARATERLFQVEHPDLPSRDCPPPNAARAHPGNLPLHYTRFVGREVELGRVGQLLLEGESRLITLTGPGGSGKTRLAVEAANRVSDAFHGGLWYVAMAEVSDLQQLLGELANVLGVTRAPGAEPLEDVVARLSLHTRHMAAESRALLLLDNFEHLLDEGAPLVRAILDRVPGVTCLITSRQAVEISGEVELPVAPLPTPDLTDDPERLMACESVMLFVDRAQAVRPDFQVTPQTAAAIGMLCSRLEGLPLALELAAQRAQVLTPAQMLEQLERRFDLLVSRRRDV
ncbi:MAG TPA: BTAD domain-containing putative transcriptional regulator, partial [Armatimonadota bacterium]|nr:BTAD domain-containing putative transcriptional regulator [Armatimonadota bacterium]